VGIANKEVGPRMLNVGHSGALIPGADCAHEKDHACKEYLASRLRRGGGFKLVGVVGRQIARIGIHVRLGPACYKTRVEVLSEGVGQKRPGRISCWMFSGPGWCPEARGCVEGDFKRQPASGNAKATKPSLRLLACGDEAVSQSGYWNSPFGLRTDSNGSD
jgi:hypothetical protein